jgi:hypothetical protein
MRNALGGMGLVGTFHRYGPGELGSASADDNDPAGALGRHLGLKLAAAAMLEVEHLNAMLQKCHTTPSRRLR